MSMSGGAGEGKATVRLRTSRQSKTQDALDLRRRAAGAAGATTTVLYPSFSSAATA